MKTSRASNHFRKYFNRLLIYLFTMYKSSIHRLARANKNGDSVYTRALYQRAPKIKADRSPSRSRENHMRRRDISEFQMSSAAPRRLRSFFRFMYIPALLKYVLHTPIAAIFFRRSPSRELSNRRSNLAPLRRAISLFLDSPGTHAREHDRI